MDKTVGFQPVYMTKQILKTKLIKRIKTLENRPALSSDDADLLEVLKAIKDLFFQDDTVLIKRAETILNMLQVPRSNSAYRYLSEAIVIGARTKLFNLDRDFYPEIAEKYGKSGKTIEWTISKEIKSIKARFSKRQLEDLLQWHNMKDDISTKDFIVHVSYLINH